ncbi:alpha/beta hydrolase [Actinomadura barringtoniae]|uniref:Alpha/beta hydrolase n=1 Tax=Actinomadura barringtoniae TaxID=1427535 RepID=A0A939PK67_9ACTN|nr:alpha/beta hydrolase [Actinomadura barringtoniae]MBO2454140.1 alpha/beta hydrolase [Actinomadura barringtoniae]
MATYVLVPGFWLGAWAWDEVAADLRAAGHEVFAVTLTGLAERAGELTRDVGVQTHVADITGVIEDNDLREVILVLHSGANVPGTGAADRIPERIKRVVYVDTGPLPSGMRGIEFFDPEEQAATVKQVESEGEGWKIPVRDLDPAADPQLLAGLTAEHLEEFARRGTPQPYASWDEAMTRPEPLPSTPKTLVLNTFPLAAVEQMASAGIPAFALMSGPEWTYRELPTGHWPMFSTPHELAEILAADA